VRAEEINIYPSTIAGMDSREIIAVITPKTTFKELEKLKTDLKAKGITLDWVNMKAEDGELFKVEGILTKGGSKRHFNVEKFSKIIISRGADENGNQSFQVHVAGDTVEPNHIPSKN
jgi:hypothetical protein